MHEVEFKADATAVILHVFLLLVAFRRKRCSRNRLKLNLMRGCMKLSSKRMRLPAQRLKETLCRTELLSHVILTRSLCHTAAAEGAKLSTMRRGRALPCPQRRVRPLITFNQRHANALLEETKTLCLTHSYILFFFFQGQTSTP